MASPTLLWSMMATIAICLIGDTTAWYVNDDPAANVAAASDYGSENVGIGGAANTAAGNPLLDDDVINSDDVKRLIGDEITDGGDTTCKRKMISVFGQLLISEYNRKHEDEGFIISSDISNRCKDDLCVLYFTVSPTQCIPSSTDPTYCDVIIVSEGQRSCHASVDINEGVVRSPLTCQLTDQHEFAKLLASMMKRPIKRWGQMHGHVHPF